jgi:histone deacetylase 1/2
MYVLVYIDDIILISSCVTVADRLVIALGGFFVVKDLGKLHYFLGLEVVHCDIGLTLTQQKYTIELRCAGMLKCKSAMTHMSATHRLTALGGDLTSDDDSTSEFSE